MQPLGISTASYREFLEALASPHSIRVDVAVLNLDEDEVARITPVVLDGQVDVDADAQVTRSCSITFLDPNHALHLDSESPDDGALYADRMLRVTYSVLVSSISDRVDVDVFTGPIVAFERAGDEVRVEALGKESLALGYMWRPLTIKRGARKVDAIRSILEDRYGETKFDLPSLAARIPKRVSLGRSAAGWLRAKRIAQSMNRQLFYDGSGVCRMRQRPRRPIFTFLAGRAVGSNITSQVTISHDFTDLANAVHMRGGKPKGQKKAVEAWVVAQRSHPLSPTRLGRENAAGKLSPRYLVREESNDNIRSKAEATRRAQAILDDALLEIVGVQFTCLPIPHLDPLDVVRVVTDDFTANVRVRRFSLPLGPGGEMTFGYNARVQRPDRGAIRRR